jgi:predicted nucleotidyltransferase
MAEESIIESVKEYLQELTNQGLLVRYGVLYGSQVRDDATELSDIDLLVVSPKFDTQRAWDDVAFLWKIAGRMDSRIEPIPCGEIQYQQDDSSAIIEIARREGQIIPLAV